LKVLFAARLVNFKDPVTFIQAAHKLPSYEFHVAGDGKLMGDCKKLAFGYENIHLLGWVSQNIVNDLMNEADVFCQLSPIENLWATTLISAMKHKKAIVCTDVGCVRQYLVDGQHVLLIPPKDDAKLIHAIIKLENAELRRMLGENACNFVEANLSLGKCAERIHELLIRETES